MRPAPTWSARLPVASSSALPTPVAVSTRYRDRRPCRVAGQAAALAALHALSLVRSGQEPLHLDLSVQEAVAYCAIPQPAASVLYEAGLLEGRGFGAPQGRLPCADGALSILVIDDHQWNRLVEAMGRPAWTEPYSTLEVRRARRDEIQDAVAAWTRTRSKFDCERILQAHGVAACAERTLADVVSNEQFLERDFLGPGEDAHLSCATLPGPDHTAGVDRRGG